MGKNNLFKTKMNDGQVPIFSVITVILHSTYVCNCRLIVARGDLTLNLQSPFDQWFNSSLRTLSFTGSVGINVGIGGSSERAD
ncbi:unnamed protein product, partial [Callosobruchus maculatus]